MKQFKTLAEWENWAGRSSYLHANGQVWIPDFVGPERANLWHLRDYFVVRVSGGTIWLEKRGRVL